MSDYLPAASASGALSLIADKGIGSVIEPLVKEIFLLDSRVAGTSHLEDRSVLETLHEGDKLTLRREADNEHDELAILLLAPDGKKVGYVPQQDNAVFARLLDAGKLLSAKVVSIEKKTEEFTLIRIAISLVDF